MVSRGAACVPISSKPVSLLVYHTGVIVLMARIDNVERGNFLSIWVLWHRECSCVVVHHRKFV